MKVAAELEREFEIRRVTPPKARPGKARTSRTAGFSLLELMLVIALIGILLTLALSQFAAYLERGHKANCLANRYHIEQEERAYYLQHNRASLAIDGRYQCPAKGVYVWLAADPATAEYPRVGCSLHYGAVRAVDQKDYSIVLSAGAMNNTIKEIYSSFSDYLVAWMAKENKLPVVNYTNGSSSWNAPLYSGSDKTNLFQAKFWSEYYEFVNKEGFNATNAQISDFKVFFKHDAEGRITPDFAGVYLQLGGERRIFFSDGTVIANKHYGGYIDATTRELTPPPQ